MHVSICDDTALGTHCLFGVNVERLFACNFSVRMNSITSLICIAVLICSVLCDTMPDTRILDKSNTNTIGRQLVEEGRTMVHHAVKRFMIILPAIFFKLGVAFTLLIMVTLVAVNNGFIGFLLLVVGLSSVLARLQGARTASVPVPYISPLPPYHSHSVWDRSSPVEDYQNDAGKFEYTRYPTQNQQFHPGLTNYYVKSSN